MKIGKIVKGASKGCHKIGQTLMPLFFGLADGVQSINWIGALQNVLEASLVQQVNEELGHFGVR